MTTLTVPSPGTFQNLNDYQREALRAWRREVQSETSEQVGLWIYGDRGAGTTYVASVAVKRLYNDGRDFSYVSALGLMDLTRRNWQDGEMMRANPTDFELTSDSLVSQETLDDL